MEAGGKDCEEETLQTAFKKLRVDAESLPGAGSVSEALAPRAASRACLDASGAKPKLGCPKDNWHGCMRKTSRGASRTQRRRRSKSPILHPPKFTYCSAAAAAASALSPPSGCLKHQRLAVPEGAEPGPACDVANPAQKELSPSATPGHISPLVFGSCAEYETCVGAAVSPRPPLKKIPAAVSAVATSPGETSPESRARRAVRKEVPARRQKHRRCPAPRTPTSALYRSSTAVAAPAPQKSPTPCSCAWQNSSAPPEESRQAAESPSQCRCRPLRPSWSGVEVYSFTGLRNVTLECEGSLASSDGDARTLSANGNASSSSPSSGSARSCSEQARTYVDDITIEDLSGYMEYYLYIPKKMSHMAEMMYT
ncbi:LOW QUALITY PROTEIN: oxidative stress-responsive serine-rich protein 1 [Perca flavescens]|uniref:LOW QUALITY PROTEIN: oxidative stress-responsive serine-rich protein 1 n=1 Tax=Perca flavescens TaxID=8167 RepID=UPI00106E4DDB|nr:LOW QUALITY PROTEIN: oxidative stress-responsive serine-rich protein 1 [Perca flavescens]